MQTTRPYTPPSHCPLLLPTHRIRLFIEKIHTNHSSFHRTQGGAILSIIPIKTLCTIRITTEMRRTNAFTSTRHSILYIIQIWLVIHHMFLDCKRDIDDNSLHNNPLYNRCIHLQYAFHHIYIVLYRDYCFRQQIRSLNVIITLTINTRIACCTICAIVVCKTWFTKIEWIISLWTT